jgi:hypothetical protein
VKIGDSPQISIGLKILGNQDIPESITTTRIPLEQIKTLKQSEIFKKCTLTIQDRTKFEVRQNLTDKI